MDSLDMFDALEQQHAYNEKLRVLGTSARQIRKSWKLQKKTIPWCIKIQIKNMIHSAVSIKAGFKIMIFKQQFDEHDIIISNLQYSRRGDEDNIVQQRDYLKNQHKYYGNSGNQNKNQSRDIKSSLTYKNELIDRNLKYNKSNQIRPYEQRPENAQFRKIMKQKQNHFTPLHQSDVEDSPAQRSDKYLLDMVDSGIDESFNLQTSQHAHTQQNIRKPNISHLNRTQVYQPPRKLSNHSNYSQKSSRNLTPHYRFQEPSPYISVAYNEQELMQKMNIGKRRGSVKPQQKRQIQIPKVRKFSANSDGGLELIGQKYLISAYMQLNQDYKVLCKKYILFRERCIESLQARERGTIVGFQEFNNQISQFSFDLTKLLDEGISAPYSSRVKNNLKTLDQFQKEMGWFLLIQEAQHYFSSEFFQTVLLYDEQKSLDILLEILEKNNLKYLHLVDEMIFQFKQGYKLYSQMSLMVESIKVWLKAFYYYKYFQDVFSVYNSYSAFKKIIKSPQVHENFVKIEFQCQQTLSDPNLPTQYRNQTQSTLLELKEYKQAYYQYFVDFKTERKYLVGLEMYESVKEMKKFLNLYNEQRTDINKKPFLRKECEKIIAKCNDVYKKVAVVLNKNKRDNTLDKLLEQFLRKFEITENAHITLVPNTKFGAKEFTHY